MAEMSGGTLNVGMLKPEIPLQAAGAQPMNPMDTMLKFQSLQHGILQNRLLGQEVKGKIARGQAARDAIDPATGQFNPDSFITNLAGNPDGAHFTLESSVTAQQQRAAQLDAERKKLELVGARQQRIGDLSGTLLTQKEPLTRDVVIKRASDALVSSGMFNDPDSQKQLISFVTSLPEDDAGIRKALQGVYLQSNMTQERINTALGAIEKVDRGPEFLTQRTSPLTGQTEVLATIPKGLDPATASSPVQVYNPATGQMEFKPRSEVTGSGQPGAPAPAGGASAPPLGAPEAAVKSAQDMSDFQQEAVKAPEQKAALLNLRDAASKFQPGPKTGWIYQVNALRTFLGLGSSQVTEETAAQEEFNKLAQQFIADRVNVLGGPGTDNKLDAAMKGAPNEMMSKEGIMGVTALMLGLNDATVARDRALAKWAEAGNGPATYRQFSTQFNKYYNPRVFQSAYMSEPQKANMMKNMTAKEREQFQRDWVFARKAGWIQ